MLTTAFAREMAVVPDADRPGRYLVDVDARWNCPVVPQGGMMTAVTAAAMAAEIDDPAQRLRTITTVFAAQVPAGPVTIDVDVLRRGRRATQASASTCAAGAAVGHRTVAVFGPDNGGYEFTDLAMPDVPPPDDCPSFRDPAPDGVDFTFDEDRPEMPFWDHVEGRPAIGHAPWDDYVPPPPTAPSGTGSRNHRCNPTARSTRLPPWRCATSCRRRSASAWVRAAQLVPPERRPHGPPVRRAAVRVAARPPAGPAGDLGVRLDRDGAVGSDRPVARGPRLADHYLVFPDGPPTATTGSRPTSAHPPDPRDGELAPDPMAELTLGASTSTWVAAPGATTRRSTTW